MKRRRVHLLFVGAALACAAAVGLDGWRLQQAERVNRAMAEAAATETAAAAAAEADAVAADATRDVRLAHAGALAAAGAYDAAFKAYGALIQPDALDAVGRHALYNLANMHLRQGMAGDAAGPATPMVELAKQRYRDLLRVAPHDWDARYNLERALRLAPEEQPLADNDAPVERRTVRLPSFQTGDLP